MRRTKPGNGADYMQFMHDRYHKEALRRIQSTTKARSSRTINDQALLQRNQSSEIHNKSSGMLAVAERHSSNMIYKNQPLYEERDQAGHNSSK